MSARQQLRRHLRVPVRLRVRVLESEGGESYYFTRNVSVGGLFLQMPPNRAVGTRVDLELLTGDDTILVRARLLRADEQGCGFEFMGLDSALRNRLRRLVNSLIDASVVSLPSSHGAASERTATYWSKGAHTVPAAIVKLSEDGAQFEGAELPDLYDHIRVFLPVESVESATSQCPAQVVNLRQNGFSVVFLEQRPEFVDAIRTLLSPAQPSLH
ncbi:MAG: PilZ domain-containing protein [Myxococcota bacterium]